MLLRIISNTSLGEAGAKKQGSSSICTSVNFAASIKAVRIQGSLNVKVPGPAGSATEGSAKRCTASDIKAITLAFAGPHQMVKAKRPPGRRTRYDSATAFPGRGKCNIPKAHVTPSKRESA